MGGEEEGINADMHPDTCLNPKIFKREDVISKLSALHKLFALRRVQLAYLFGSVVENRATPLSDLDIAILLDEGCDLKDSSSELYNGLCSLMSADNIDIVLLSRTSPALKFKVIKTGLLIYALSDDIKVKFVEEAIFEYQDTRWIREEARYYLYQHIKQGLFRELEMIDEDIVRRFLGRIREAVQQLRELGYLSFEEYVSDRNKRALSEHYLRIAIEASLDLGRHIIAAKGLGIPEEYRQIGEILRDNGVISYELGEKLIAMAGMRNILVHLYWSVDYHILYEVIDSQLTYFDEYACHIIDYIDKGRS
jgi:uncharacterized protein YutE (UPF0331/DUF86 family)/predicted nucleotidyltransferase